MKSSKIISFSQLSSVSNCLHECGKTIILTTGVFDLFHHGHHQFLDKAKKQGDVLMVGLETDKRVRKLKGQDRPKHPLSLRLKHVADHPAVDYVFALPSEFDHPAHHEQLIAAVKPTCFATSQHSPNIDKKQALVEKYGGKLSVVMQQDKTISTTQLLILSLDHS